MEIDLVKIAREYPDMIVSVRVGDLVSANKILLSDTVSAMEEQLTRKNKVTFQTREQVLETLNVASSTLWRWQKSGYLVPINVGGQRRYKSSDIDEILEGKR